MNIKTILKLSLVSTLVGFLFFSINRGWLIINTPFIGTHEQIKPIPLPQAPQKKVTLFFWNGYTWQQETTQLVWNEYMGQNIAYLINSWLWLLDDEKITSKKVTLQTAMLNCGETELYISFDRSLFSKEDTTYKKWMLIEGLLKTLRENGVKISMIRFLIHHQPMIDPHLDFNSAWPIQGFIDA